METDRDIARRQMRWEWQTATQSLETTREELLRAAYFAKQTIKASACYTLGRHNWGTWKPSTSPFAQPETALCRRCLARKYRGKYPAIRVEIGTLNSQ